MPRNCMNRSTDPLAHWPVVLPWCHAIGQCSQLQHIPQKVYHRTFLLKAFVSESFARWRTIQSSYSSDLTSSCCQTCTALNGNHFVLSQTAMTELDRLRLFFKIYYTLCVKEDFYNFYSELWQILTDIRNSFTVELLEKFSTKWSLRCP